ncbi:hypothetical protein ACOZZ3_001569 [Cronobacter dublinensis]
MDVIFFKKEIEPYLTGYVFQYSSFLGGDFGDLERVEFEGCNKIGTIDFWSKGWIGIDIYDFILSEQLINLLLGPDEEQLKAIESLVRILSSIEEKND